MKYELKKLNYEYNALEPAIDAKTVEIHYSKHHATYLAKLNAALESEPTFKAPATIEELIQNLDEVPESILTAVRNNGGGVWNHTFYWDSFTPNKTIPDAKLLEKINASFGSFENFKKEFTDAATGFFGSGWVWLCQDESGKLVIVKSVNQDSPIMGAKIGFAKLNPIFCLDIWEHAYYLKYQNRRPEYIAAIWDIINYNELSRRLK